MNKKIGKTVTKLREKIGKIAAMVTCFLTMVSMTANAGIADSKIVTGTTQLIADATTAATAIIAGLTALMFVINMIKYQSADEDEKPHKKKIVKLTVIIGCVATAGVGLVAVILNYYQ